MNFTIQAGRPRIIEGYEVNIENINDAIENIYELNSEYAVIIWNYIPILLSYKYDISEIVTDIVKMLSSLRLNDNGKMKINWPSNTFRSVWNLEWKDGKVQVNSKWDSVIGETECLLNQNSFLDIDIIQFSSEWKRVLEIIIEDLKKCGYNEDLDGMTELIKTYYLIDNYGELYC